MGRIRNLTFQLLSWCLYSDFWSSVFWQWLRIYIRQLMKRKYIIEISQGQSYPFDGQKQGFERVLVRTMHAFASKSQAANLYDKIHLLLKIGTPYLVSTIRVLEMKGKQFRLDYQYVAEPLKNSSKTGESNFLPALREKLYQLFQLLAQNGIKKDVKIEDIGLTPEDEPKVFLGLNFIVLEESDRKTLASDYQLILEKLLESNFNYRDTMHAQSDNTHISDYSQRLDKKLNEMQGRLNKMRANRSGHSSQDSLPNSEGTKRRPNENNLVLQSMTAKQSNNNSFTSGMPSNSCIATQQPFRPKIHKSSFGDYSTSSYRLNQSGNKEGDLTKRISSALEKTQWAFKIYEKYSRGRKKI